MTRQVSNEIDEFVTEAVRNNLVGLPLDLAAINIARGRDTGVPTLNKARAEFFADDGRQPAQALHELARLGAQPEASRIGRQFHRRLRHASTITVATTLADKRRDAATAIVLGGARRAPQTASPS